MAFQEKDQNVHRCRSMKCGVFRNLPRLEQPEERCTDQEDGAGVSVEEEKATSGRAVV